MNDLTPLGCDSFAIFFIAIACFLKISDPSRIASNYIMPNSI